MPSSSRTSGFSRRLVMRRCSEASFGIHSAAEVRLRRIVMAIGLTKMRLRGRELPSDSERVRELKGELWAARHATLRLLSQDIQDLFSSYYHVETRQDSYKWRRDVVGKVIERAEPVPSGYGSDRAVCPLCKEGPQSPYDNRFTIPEGLSRHLTGEYNAHQCFVARIAFALADEHFDDKFLVTEIAEREAERARREQRTKTETLYRIRPESAGQLSEHRTPESLTWAESRLVQELGFQVIENGRIKSYVREHGDLIVWADPLWAGTIMLRAYKNSKRPRKALTEIAIRDNWRHGLRDKYEQFVRSATTKLVP